MQASAPPVALALLLSACASPLAAHLANPRAHPSYPPERFLTGVGRSAASAQEAEADARRVIAEQIRLELQSVFESEQREQSRDGEIRSAADTRAAVRAETHFSHAELIRVEQSLGARHEGEFYAFAYASIDELQRTLSEDYARAAQPFRDTVEAAATAPDLPSYATAYRKAREGYDQLTRAARELRAVTRRPHPAYAEDTARYRALVQGREARLQRAQLSTQVVPEGELGEGSERIDGLLTQALNDLGVTAQSGACQGGLALRLTARAQCGRASLGQRCTLALKADLRPCGADRAWTQADLSSPDFKGISPRSQAEAKAAMWSAVTREALAAQLRAGLSAALPLE